MYVNRSSFIINLFYAEQWNGNLDRNYYYTNMELNNKTVIRYLGGEYKRTNHKTFAQ